MTATLRSANREQAMRQLIAERGLRVERFGAGWRVCGPGVDVLITQLRFLSETDLTPARDGGQ